MQGRMWCGIALGVVSTLGGWGCSAAPKRSEAPIQFRQWKPSGGASAASEKAKPAGEATFPVTPPEVAGAKPRASIWNYRPGSLLFRRKTSAPPTAPAPVGESDGALSRFFPGLSGKDQGDALRLTRKGAGLDMDTVATAGGRPASRLSAAYPVLPVGLRVEAYPKAPTPTLPEGRAMAKRDRTPVAAPADERITLGPTGGERLTSHETQDAPASMMAPAPDSAVDPLSLDLPTPSGRIEPGSVDAESRPAVAAVEAPDRMTPVEVTPGPSDAQAAPDETAPTPAREAPARMAPVLENPDGEARIETRPVEPLLPVDPIRPPPTSVAPVRPSPSAPIGLEKPTGDASAMKERPTMGRVAPMILPPAEFPATYHAQSLSRVLKEEAPIDLDARTTAAPGEPRRTLFPRLARLMGPKSDQDRSVERASHPEVRAAAPAPGRVRASALGEPGEIPEWWKAG